MKTLTALILTALIALPAAATDRPTQGQKIWLNSSQDIRNGAALIDAGKFEEGVKLTRKALDDDLTISDIAAAYTNLCSADVQTGRYQQAMEHCEKALKINSRMPEALNNVATVQFMLGDYQTAVATYKKALRGKPFDDLIMGNLLLAQRKLQETQQATDQAKPSAS